MNYKDLKQIKKASIDFINLDTDTKNSVLIRFKEYIKEYKDNIFEQNIIDINNAKKDGSISDAFIERLTITDKTIKGMIDGIDKIIEFDDPVGRYIRVETLQNGLLLKKKTVPFGVIGIIYESRPNVTVDSFCLCLKSGNACVLKGGSEAINSNKILVSLAKKALSDFKVDKNLIYLIDDTSRESTLNLLKQTDLIDLIIPRGGKGLIDFVKSNSMIPIIETGAGNCHMYIDETADLDLAAKVSLSAKISRPSVCNALEKILIHKKILNVYLNKIIKLYIDNGVEIRADKFINELYPEYTKLATEADWDIEYNDYIIAIKAVDSIYEAIDHINTHSTNHSEAIISENINNVELFFEKVDSAALYHNASTRFTDGGEFGLGSEIGISTQKLHVRGPVGLNELVTYKYLIYGNGNIR